jgi:NAD(P)-dependent dehydrogenase (short-subunit alcohol dehydrogenase family)
MAELTDRVALVTGASRGIGAAVAHSLSAAGARLGLASRSGDDLGIEGAVARPCDVRDPAAIDALVGETVERFGGLDIVHNNAGVGTPRPRFPDASAEGWERTLAIDLWAVIAGTQAAVPALKRRGGGVIVNTASIAGLMAYAPDPIYAAAKHGVVGFTRSMEHLKAEANIRVNCVCPGVVDTPMVRFEDRNMTAEEIAQRESFLKTIPLIAPETIAEAVLTLIRDDSLNGVAMAVTFGRPPRIVEAPMRFNRQDPAQQQ